MQAAYVFGLDDDHDGRAAAPVDIDGDGDLDLALLTLRGLKLLENTSAPRRFARVRLLPRGSPAAALGAEVAVTAGGVVRRDIVRLTEGFRTQTALDLHFGLGAAAAIDTLEVRWPSGETDTWRDLPVDRLLLVDQAAGAVGERRLPRWSEGSRPTASGAPSPAVVAQVLDGDRAPLAGGRAAVVNFWAPWCPPCNVELPQLVELAGRYAGEVDFAGVSVELDDLDSVRGSIERFAIPYPQFLADDALMERFFGSEAEAALPATFVFDPHGRLRRLFRGAVTDAELDAVLASFRHEAVSEDALRLLAETYAGAGDHARAAEYYQRLAQLEPTHLDQIGQAWQRRRARDWLAAARAQRALGAVEAALASYAEALRLDPDNRAARREGEALAAR